MAGLRRQRRGWRVDDGGLRLQSDVDFRPSWIFQMHRPQTEEESLRQQGLDFKEMWTFDLLRTFECIRHREMNRVDDGRARL
ncbi:Hypothetical predicted protein [Olea europaea subsp. europaea]|uniref:Uncharacterized protein n=1 Tax=Olea europaea subsp. europaea TaxID=158383 RepID=A0A8S0STC8_OLEEU|nr:Hypothetical predicted protein [Olea europaea subsp. europaea]